MALPRILVTGAHGQLGQEIQAIAHAFPGFAFIFTDRQELSIHSQEAVDAFFAKTTPDYCINCAAYTAVDKAETDRELAMAVNATGAGFLAKASQAYGTKLLHVSTDYVFDGKGTAPYREDDNTNPVNYYGETKLQGERLCILHNPESIVIRTSWVYSEFGHNFVKTMLRLMKEKERLSVVADQWGSPTYAADLAQWLLRIIASHKNGLHNWQPGIYHFSNEGVTNWHAFATAIRDQSGSNCEVLAIPSSAYPTPASRPGWSVMSKEKIVSTFGWPIPQWEDGLKRMLAKINTTAGSR